MVAVTINRFVIIGYYKYYSKVYTARNVYLMIAALWMFSFGMVRWRISNNLNLHLVLCRLPLLCLIFGERLVWMK